MERAVDPGVINTGSTGRSWQAELKLKFGLSGGRSVLTELRHQGPLRVQQLFYPEKAADAPKPCHCYIVHPPGALVNGDELRQAVSVTDGARVLITTPAAGKFYKSAGPLQRQTTELKVLDGDLAWLPQETLFYDQAKAQLALEVEVSPDSAFVGAEINCFGRFDLGEYFEGGSCSALSAVSREGRPLLTERLRVDPEPFHWTSPFTLYGRPCLLSLYAVPRQADEGRLTELTQTLQQRLEGLELAQGLAAATCRGGLLSLRYLGSSLQEAKRVELAALTCIYPAFFARPFVTPRIWNT